MNRTRRVESVGRRLQLLAMGTGLALGGWAFGQGEKPAPFTAGTVLVIEHASLDTMFADPKDKALGDALAMFPARVRELPREAKDMPPEAAGLINMLATTLARPGRLAITYNGDNPSGGGFGYGAIFSTLTAGKDDADTLHAQISALVAQAQGKNGGGPRPVPSKRFPGMTDMQTPAALLSFGPREAKDGWRYEVVLGTVTDPDAVTAPLPAAVPGLEPLLRARFDLAGLTPAMELAKSFGANNPEAQEGIAKLQEYGIGGDGAVKMSYQTGRTKTESVSYTVIEGAKKMAATWGLGSRTLGKEDFAAIPADATSVFFMRGVDKPIMNLAEIAKESPEMQEGLAKFQETTGVNLQGDVLDALGGGAAVYLSDSTGGGGMGSAVVLLGLRDKAKFATAMNKLAAVANMAADKLPMGPGYVRLISSRDGSNDLMTLRFPGLPVPAELTFVMTEKWLVLAATPQAALVASRQIAGKGDGGLMANAAFSSRLPADKQLTGFSYSDTARYLGDGYMPVSMLGSAIANAMRSPTDPSREPGLVVPVFNDLKRDVKPAIGFTYWKGEDLVTESHADHSMLVRGTSIAGTIVKVLPLMAIPAIGAAQKGNLGMIDMTPYQRVLAAAGRAATAPFTAENAAWALADSGNLGMGEWVRSGTWNAALPVKP